MERATTEQVIQYLLEEIAEEEAYDNNFKQAKEQAIADAETEEIPTYLWWKLMPKEYLRAPRRGIIAEYNRVIQRLREKQRNGG